MPTRLFAASTLSVFVSTVRSPVTVKLDNVLAEMYVKNCEIVP